MNNRITLSFLTPSLFFVYAVFFISIVNAQESIKVGTPYNVIDGQYKSYFEKDGKLLAIKVEAKRVFIQLFDQSSLTILKRTHFDLSSHQTLEKVMEMNGHYLVFYSVISHREDNVHLFCKEIILESATVTEARLVLKSKAPLHGIQSLNAEATPTLISEANRDYIPVFNFEWSQDKSKVAIHYSCVRPAGASNSVIGIHILNQDLAVLSSKETEVPYSLYQALWLDYAVDNEGNFYMARNTYEEEVPWFKRTIRNDVPYQTSMLVFPWNSASFFLNAISLPEKKVSRLKFAETNKGAMKVAGFYHQEGTLVCIKGFFSASIDHATGKLENTVSHDIPQPVLNPYLDSKEEANANPYFEDVVLKKVMAQEDNSLVLMGEQVYDIEKTKSYPGEQKQIDLNHHYNDIFICKLDSLGEVVWLKRLPKRQVGGKERGGMSYRYLSLEGNHFFLFLDNAKNKSLAPNVRPTAHLNEQGGQLTYYKVEDANGNTDKKNLLDMRNANGYSFYQFSSNRITKVNEKELILELYKRDNEDVLIHITLF